MKEKATIILNHEGSTKRVHFDDYVRAKLKALREFGYPDLTLTEVEDQATKVLDGIKGIGEGKLTVIGMLMQDEITKEPTND